MLRLVFLAGGLLSLAQAEAAAAPACEAVFQKLRFEEDASCGKGAGREGVYEWPKFIPLGRAESWIGLGGEIRQRYQFTNNPEFGAGRQDKAGLWLPRYSVHGDLHLGKHIRFFGQLSSALQNGQAGEGSPVEENQLSWQNAFIELSASDSALAVRAGRQEVQFGSGRLLDVREGTNVRRSFDGIRAFAAHGKWKVDFLALRPRLSRSGTFDDRTRKDQAIWAVYATGAAGFLPGNLDLYYIGFESDTSAYVQGTEKELRHSIGLRAFGEHANWDWNWETLYQFGSFGPGSIRAWTVASQTGYSFAAAPWTPRLEFGANIASGDDDPADTDLGTFNPLFPRGNYFSEAAVLGPQNFYNIRSLVSVKPAANWSLTTSANFFWRLEKKDGVYTPGGSLLRGPDGSDERFVASAFSLSSEHAVTESVDATAIYTRLFAGPFIRDTGPGSDIDFIELTLRFRF